MALFGKIFKGNQSKKTPKGFSAVKIKSIDRLTNDAVKVTLDTTQEFIPGQYIDFLIEMNGEELRRSYSICSGKNEPLAVAVKEVEKGKVSKWFNNEASAGLEVLVSKPTGNFTLSDNDKNIVAIAAGSGITPILSIAKTSEQEGKQLRLFYGNRTVASTLFKETIDNLKNTNTTYYFSGEDVEGEGVGRLDKDALTSIVKSDLSILRADGYFLCGPEELIINSKEVLEMFGVAKDKIHYELFTTPVNLKQGNKEDTSNDFVGISNVTIILDDETDSFDLATDGPTILNKAKDEGIDVPFSCMGGVCSTCRAKVLQGKARMDMNYSLTDREVEDGFILTCQSHPVSEKIVVSYDE